MKNERKPNPAIQSVLEHLAQETIHPEKVNMWPALQASLAARKTLSKHKELSVNKRLLLSVGTAVLFLTIVVVFMARSATPVSAQAILDKAYAAQSSASPAQGIEHIRSEIYTNLQALPGDQGKATTVESYHDLQSGKIRLVTIDNQTGKVLEVFAYDGAFTYSVEAPQNNGDPLTVYRTPQGQVADMKPLVNGDGLKSKDMFDKMRNDPNVQLAGEETWQDGRKVYALRTQEQIKVVVNDQVERPMGAIIVYFDVATYEMVGNRVTTEKDGQEVIVSSQKILANEILPEGSSVAWDLSDLQSITLTDDPNREHGDLLPEVITPQQLAERTSTAYLLNAVPDGYSLEISEPERKRGSSEPYMYIASYRTEANDYFVIQATGGEPKMANDGSHEVYTTASGLILHLMRETPDLTGRQYVSASVEAPNGVGFTITSTLPLETVKAWAENLVLVK